MFKRTLSVLLTLAVLVAGLVPVMPTHATANSPNKVLLLYQERNFFADQRDSVSVIEELLGHFDVTATESAISAFDPKNLKNYDSVFVIALDQTIDNPPLIQALANYAGRIVWLGSSVSHLIQAGQYPLQYEGENYNFVTLEFQAQQALEPQFFSIGEKRTFYQIRSLSNDNQVFAWLSDGLHRVPYLIQSRNLSYVSRVDMNEPLFYIFAAYLHQLFPSKDTPDQQLLVSIQDVHGFSDQENLKALADVFNDKQIPFTVQLIPYFRMQGTKTLTRYDSIPGFVDTLKYLESKGGNLVVEAFPTELGDKTLSALPLNTLYKSPENPLATYLESTFLLLLEQGLHPIGVSSPHSTLTDEEYAYIRAHISNYIGHRYITEGQLVIYPFVLEETKRFNRFYPLNLGYIDPNETSANSMFDEQLSKILLVPNPFAGVYISPDLPPSEIAQMAEKADQKALDFFNLSAEPSWVRFDSVSYTEKEVQAGTKIVANQPIPLYVQAMALLSNSVLILLVFGLVLFAILFTRSTRLTQRIHRRR